MAEHTNSPSVRAEEVEGLRELVTQILREERTMFAVRPLVEDMEELRRSPAGAVIRLEEKVDRLALDMADVTEELGEIRMRMATKEDLQQIAGRLQRLEEAQAHFATKDDIRRLEEAQAQSATKDDMQQLAGRLQRLEEAQAQSATKDDMQQLAGRLQRLEKAQAQSATKDDMQQLAGRLQRLEAAQANFATRDDIRRLEAAQANFATRDVVDGIDRRLQQVEKELRLLTDSHHKLRVDIIRLFFVLLIVMILLNGDKVVNFLSLLIP